MSGVFHCLTEPMRIYAEVAKPGDWIAPVAAIPDQCARPHDCAHGSCQRVAQTYLRDMHQRARTWAHPRLAAIREERRRVVR